jgi:hypothetical protein
MSSARDDIDEVPAEEPQPNLRYWRGGPYERSYAWGRWRIALASAVILGVVSGLVQAASAPTDAGGRTVGGSGAMRLAEWLAVLALPLVVLICRWAAVRHGGVLLAILAAAMASFLGAIAASTLASDRVFDAALAMPSLLAGALVGLAMLGLTNPWLTVRSARFLYDEEHRRWFRRPVLVGRCAWLPEYFQNDDPINLDTLVFAQPHDGRVILVWHHPSKGYRTGQAVQPGSSRWRIDGYMEQRNDLLLVSLTAVAQKTLAEHGTLVLPPGWVERRFVTDMIERTHAAGMPLRAVQLPAAPPPLPRTDVDGGSGAAACEDDGVCPSNRTLKP